MPVRLTPAEETEALKLGGSDIKFLLAREQVEESLQAKMFSVGITTMARFAAIAKDEDDLKKVLKDEFELDASVDLASRVKVAGVLVAFKAASSRSERVTEIEGEMSAKRLQKPLPMSEYTAMRMAWEQRYWPLEDSQTPGRSYVEKRCDDLESGDFRHEPLTSVLSREEDTSECFISFWDSAGQLQLKKGGSSVPEPSNPEALRRRLKLMGTLMMWLGMRHTNRPTLQNLNPQDIEDFLGYLLGEHVWLLTGRAADGSTVATPSWSQLLVYEAAIRRRAFSRMMTDNLTFKEALKESYKDPVTKERYFTTPLALAATNKRPLAFNDNFEGDRSWKTRKAKQGGKGNKGEKGGKGSKGEKGAGKGGKGTKGAKGGKGKGKGHNYCFAYNNSWERCRTRNCPYEHRCLKCGGRHPLYQCSNAESPAAETQGTPE